jgi:glycosyltransferase involved in cell wall biosynthesis
LRLSAWRGPRFYLSLQWELRRWLNLHATRLDAIWCNDLDTLAPAVLDGRLPVVYDSHEYFTEAAGLTGRPLRRAVWLALERWAMRKLPCMITVNESIATAYRRKYGLDVFVVRNMPRRQPPVEVELRTEFAEFGIPSDLPIALMQGAYMDRDRGAAQAVAALPTMRGVRLVLVGAGVEWDEACAQVQDPRFEGRLHCIPKLPFERLRRLTASADVGLSLDQGGHGNYEMSLPNKLFDFMHARLPMVVTARKEVAALVREHDLGEVLEESTPEAIDGAVARVLARSREEWRDGLAAASEQFHWGVDEPQILKALETSLNAHLAGSQGN